MMCQQDEWGNKMIEKLKLAILSGPYPEFERIASDFLKRYRFEPEYVFGVLRLPQDAVRMEKSRPYETQLLRLRKLAQAYGRVFAGNAREDLHVTGIRHGFIAREGTETRSGEWQDGGNPKREKPEREKPESENPENEKPEREKPQSEKPEIELQSGEQGKGAGKEINASTAAHIADEADAVLAPLFEEKSARKAELTELKRSYAELERRMEQAAARLKEGNGIEEAKAASRDVNEMHTRVRGLQEQIFDLDVRIADYLQMRGEMLKEALAALETDALVRRLRGYGAVQAGRFVLCGWMRKKELAALQEELPQEASCTEAAPEDICAPLRMPVLIGRRWLFRRFRPFDVG